MNIIAVINEEVQRLFEQRVYTIPELAQALEVQGHCEQNQKILQDMLLNAYRQGGDPAVIEMYTEMAGVEIEAIRNGRYMFANLYNPEQHLEEVEDNCCHTPDEMPS